MTSVPGIVAALIAAGVVNGAVAAPPSIESFAARPRIESASISPDGHYLALIQISKGRGAVVILDRQANDSDNRKVVLGEPDEFHLS